MMTIVNVMYWVMQSPVLKNSYREVEGDLRLVIADSGEKGVGGKYTETQVLSFLDALRWPTDDVRENVVVWFSAREAEAAE